MQNSAEEFAAPIRLHSRQTVGENTVFSVFFDHVSGAGDHDVLHYLSVVPKHATVDGITGIGLVESDQIEDAGILATPFLYFGSNDSRRK